MKYDDFVDKIESLLHVDYNFDTVEKISRGSFGVTCYDGNVYDVVIIQQRDLSKGKENNPET